MWHYCHTMLHIHEYAIYMLYFYAVQHKNAAKVLLSHDTTKLIFKKTPNSLHFYFQHIV